jgi:hypothetical protein
MLQSFSRAANLRLWLGRPDCPPAIRECKKLFDKWYGTSASDNERQCLAGDGVFVQSLAPEDVAYSKGVPVPSDLCHLVSSTKITLQVRLTHNGVVYARSSTHLGNSLVQFYARGNVHSPLICGCIKYIFNLNGKMVFAIQRQLLAPTGTVDPFDQYPHFPAALYALGLAEELEIIDVGWVVCHYARWQHSIKLVMVLSLLQVCIACEFPRRSLLTPLPPGLVYCSHHFVHTLLRVIIECPLLPPPPPIYWFPRPLVCNSCGRSGTAVVSTTAIGPKWLRNR